MSYWIKTVNHLMHQQHFVLRHERWWSVKCSTTPDKKRGT